MFALSRIYVFMLFDVIVFDGEIGLVGVLSVERR